ncbi:MAG TPA: 3-oxoacyl-[acyl-carrier-protein] synthase III C-terminal domain-containing protein [Myxococcales bacterium]|jgi:3-oxoacyl-[acyl-carrier-protein] synthase-3
MRRCRIESLGVSPPRKTFFRWGSIKHAVHAGKQCLKQSIYNPNDVRVLVNAGVHRDRHICEPAIAAYIQHGLDINVEFQGRRTLAFDLLNGACGMLNAAQVVAALIEAGDAQVGMVVSSEANADANPDPSYLFPTSGAAALLDVSPLRNVGFGRFVFQTHEEHVDLFASTVSLAVKLGKLSIRRAIEIEEIWLKHAGAAVDELLSTERLAKSEIDFVVPAQISPFFLQKLPERLGLPREKFVDLTANLADTHSTSTFLALHHLVSSGQATSGKRALLLAFGSGVTIGAATYRF